MMWLCKKQRFRKEFFMRLYITLTILLLMPLSAISKEGSVIKLQQKLGKGRSTTEISKRVQRCSSKKIKKIKFPYSNNELLYYIVALKDIPIGKVYLKIVKGENKDGQVIFKVLSKAKTNSFFSKVYKVNAYLKDEFSASDFSNISFYEDVTEKNNRRKTTYTFHKDGSVTTITEREDEKMTKTYKGGKQTMDFLSLLYMVRGLPLEKGNGYCFEVFYHKYYWNISGSVIRKERIQTPMGFFNAIYIEGSAVRKDKPSVKKHLKLWISDDNRRVLLKGETMMNMGEVTGYIAYIKQGDPVKNEDLIIGDETDNEE